MTPEESASRSTPENEGREGVGGKNDKDCTTNPKSMENNR